MLSGSCLCGAVAYEVDADAGPIVHCHCQSCRKTHGAAFSSIMAVPRDHFRFVRGDALLNTFESSPGKSRKFCSRCGSHIVAQRDQASVTILRLGCLDTPIEAADAYHIWRSDGASWYDPKSELPEFAEAAPRRG
jgi:hypothetical protein